MDSLWIAVCLLITAFNAIKLHQSILSHNLYKKPYCACRLKNQNLITNLQMSRCKIFRRQIVIIYHCNLTNFFHL